MEKKQFLSLIKRFWSTPNIFLIMKMEIFLDNKSLFKILMALQTPRWIINRTKVHSYHINSSVLRFLNRLFKEKQHFKGRLRSILLRESLIVLFNNIDQIRF